MRNQINISNIEVEGKSGYTVLIQSSITKLKSGTNIVGELPIKLKVRRSEWGKKKDKILDHCIRTMKKKDNKNITDGELISPETYSLNGTFPNIQASDYQPVYAFDYEDELNEAKRTIKLIDKRFASQIKSELKKVMNG